MSSIGAACVVAVLARPVAADEGVPMGAMDARSVFFIARSHNKNQVHYGVHLDGSCAPVGSRPVFGYWRMLEERDRVEPILGIEESAYGIDDAQRVERGPSAATVTIRLRAFPDRPLVITIEQKNGRCEASAFRDTRLPRCVRLEADS
ncbi:MAG TPA: DUF4833 domain-containing protein [Polyangiaceae bacterium]|nr:DUF4833 domain-containing protein [Polyangiaceae bacterium]